MAVLDLPPSVRLDRDIIRDDVYFFGIFLPDKVG